MTKKSDSEKIINQVVEFEKRSPHEENLPADPNAVLTIAMNRGYDPALIEKMMDLQERNEKREAKKAYVKAMTAFKADPPKILKDRDVNFETSKGRTSYSHASLANVTNSINEGLSKHGLSASWKTEQPEKEISVTCTITHEQGHSESTTLKAAADTTGNKNAIQAIGSTVSYLERYTVLALTGLATFDMDNDGGGAPEDREPIDEKQYDQLVAMLDDVEATEKDTAQFLHYLTKKSGIEIKELKSIPATLFKVATTALESKKKEMEKQND